MNQPRTSEIAPNGLPARLREGILMTTIEGVIEAEAVMGAAADEIHCLHAKVADLRRGMEEFRLAIKNIKGGAINIGQFIEWICAIIDKMQKEVE